MKIEILIVEDDCELQSSMSEYLESLNFKCVIAHSLKEAKQKFERKLFPIVLLDLGMPDGDGLSVIPIIKSLWEKTGIIIISAREKLEDRVDGLDLGADDYLVKPFHLSELNARINALLRRNFKKVDKTIEFGEIIVNTSRKLVKINNIDIEFTKKEYEILVFFLENKNRVITKENLFEYVWGENSVFMDHSDFIYTQITRLRRKLKKYTSKDYIKTIYGFGYQLKQ
ncbi:MAG: response regulator transcription factor [Marinifilaceae bacterium]|jgi:DNA-binding response OmpR family regulator|nr:response regulator transcription factor [Marinifilaceae bacterium]